MEQLEGTMESLVFQSEDNQFCVFRMKSPTLGMVTAVYRGQAPFLGEMIRGAGEWVRHARFGQQFKLSSYQPVKPSSVTGMERFLSSGAVKGIGKTMAARIVEHFGTETMTVLESFPERLAEVPGIGAKKAEAIGQSYSEISDLRELMLFLEENGVSGNYAAKLQAAYGDTAITRIKADPYILAEDIEGIGFKTADRIAMSLGLDPASAERIRAGMGFALSMAVTEGHTCIPEEELIRKTVQLLQLEYGQVEEVFNRMLAGGHDPYCDCGGTMPGLSGIFIPGRKRSGADVTIVAGSS